MVLKFSTPCNTLKYVIQLSVAVKGIYITFYENLSHAQNFQYPQLVIIKQITVKILSIRYTLPAYVYTINNYCIQQNFNDGKV